MLKGNSFKFIIYLNKISGLRIMSKLLFLIISSYLISMLKEKLLMNRFIYDINSYAATWDITLMIFKEYLKSTILPEFLVI